MQGQTSPMNAAAQLAQKAMLVRSLQNNPTAPANMWQQRQANAMVPGTQAAGANAVGQNPQVLAMQQQMQQPLQPPMQPMMDPSLMPPPGVS
jgi:hypothetical protein